MMSNLHAFEICVTGDVIWWRQRYYILVAWFSYMTDFLGEKIAKGT